MSSGVKTELPSDARTAMPVSILIGALGGQGGGVLAEWLVDAATSAAATHAFGEGAVHFESHAALAEVLGNELREGVRVLVKGSRGSAMDRIVAALVGTQEGDTHAA